MDQTSEAGKILDKEDPVMVAFRVLAQLQERIESGEKFPHITDQELANISGKTSFSFQELNGLLSALWSDSAGGIQSFPVGSQGLDVLGPQGQVSEVWHDCYLTYINEKGNGSMLAAVVEIPDNPVKVVYWKPDLKLYGLENATQDQIRKAATFLEPLMAERIKRGRPRKQIYDDAHSRIKAGEPRAKVRADVLGRYPKISTQAFNQAIYRRDKAEEDNGILQNKV